MNIDDLLDRQKKVNTELYNVRKKLSMPIYNNQRKAFLLILLLLLITLPLASVIIYRDLMTSDIDVNYNTYPTYNTDNYNTENIKQFIDIRNMTQCLSIQSENKISYYCDIK